MNKLFIIAVVILTTFCSAAAQEVGVRFGNVTAGNVAIDAAFGLTKDRRIHADLSFGDGAGIDVLLDFINKPIGKEAFNWYAGVGPYVKIADPFWLGVAGEIGLEYRFQGAPVALGFDWRPAISIVEVTDFHAEPFGLNVRYVF